MIIVVVSWKGVSVMLFRENNRLDKKEGLAFAQGKSN